jgi:hypothetical protein
LNLGFIKQRGCHKIERCELGTVEEIRIALTEGGYDITSLVRAKGLNITRERARQIISEYGMTGKAYHRELLWYAYRLVGLDKTELAHNLIDKGWVTKQLAESGGIYGLAAKLAVTEANLRNYIKLRMGLETNLLKSHGEMVELKCSFDGKPIWRLKRVIDRDKITRPNKVTYFCNKICQGKYLGSLPKKNVGTVVEV